MLAQAVVECRDSPTGQMHRAQNMLKSRVLGGRKDPPGGLQLVDVPQPLDPRMVDHLTFGRLPARPGNCSTRTEYNRGRRRGLGFRGHRVASGELWRTRPISSSTRVKSPVHRIGGLRLTRSPRL